MVEGGMEPPEGVTPDFDNPVKMVWTASIVTQALCISVVGGIIGLRIYVRMRIIQSFQLEDWLIIAGYLLAVGYSTIALIMNHYGGGINMWEVPKDNIAPFGITVYCTMIIYGPCAFCIKASILVFIARIFGPIKRAVLFIHIILGALLAYYLPVLFLKAVICRPISKFWNPTIEGQCFNQRALILADSIISVLSDLIIFVAPLPLTLDLQMKRKKRIKVAAVFSAGGLACICSVIRLIDIVQNGTSPNQTLVFMRVNLWGIAEVYIGLITACMPVLPAFWKHLFGGEDSTGFTRHGSSTDGALRMSTLRRGGKGGDTGTTRKTPDTGSDENVLITDILGPPRSHYTRPSSDRTRRGDMENERAVSPTSAFAGEGMQITKTLEIKQTYE